MVAVPRRSKAQAACLKVNEGRADSRVLSCRNVQGTVPTFLLSFSAFSSIASNGRRGRTRPTSRRRSMRVNEEGFRLPRTSRIEGIAEARLFERYANTVVVVNYLEEAPWSPGSFCATPSPRTVEPSASSDSRSSLRYAAELSQCLRVNVPSRSFQRP